MPTKDYYESGRKGECTVIARVGTDFYNGVEREIYDIDGVCTCDGYVKTGIGMKNRTCGYLKVAAGESKSGSKIFLTVSLWDKRASLAYECKRGDRVMVRGILSVSKRDAASYLNVVGNFLAIEASPGYVPQYREPFGEYENEECGIGVDDINDGGSIE
ncbi:MAG: hypothetical protein RR394_09735 [Oscillospiraceae bacterium]